jgi:hypothetical protein
MVESTAPLMVARRQRKQEGFRDKIHTSPTSDLLSPTGVHLPMAHSAMNSSMVDPLIKSKPS